MRSKNVVLLGSQVPQECSQAVSDMVEACLDQRPNVRPTSQQIICIIEASMADNAAGDSSTSS